MKYFSILFAVISQISFAGTVSKDIDNNITYQGERNLFCKFYEQNFHKKIEKSGPNRGMKYIEQMKTAEGGFLSLGSIGFDPKHPASSIGVQEKIHFRSRYLDLDTVFLDSTTLEVKLTPAKTTNIEKIIFHNDSSNAPSQSISVKNAIVKMSDVTDHNEFGFTVYITKKMPKGLEDHNYINVECITTQDNNRAYDTNIDDVLRYYVDIESLKSYFAYHWRSPESNDGYYKSLASYHTAYMGKNTKVNQFLTDYETIYFAIDKLCESNNNKIDLKQECIESLRKKVDFNLTLNENIQNL